jgi:hypothetical protein
MLALHGLGQRGAGGHARRAAVGLVADLLDYVLTNADREADYVAAGRVARLTRTGGLGDLADVARPDEVIYDLRLVGIRYQVSAFAWPTQVWRRASVPVVVVRLGFTGRVVSFCRAALRLRAGG